MEEKILQMDDALKDVRSRLCALEENIATIKGHEKRYNEAFIVLKKIEKTLKQQEYNPEDRSQSLRQDSENRSQVEEDVTEKCLSPGVSEGNSGRIPCTGIVKVEDFTELTSSMYQMQEKLASVEKDVTFLTSSATKDEGVAASEDHSGNQFKALLMEQMDLVKEEFEKMQKSHWQRQNHDLELKFQELRNKNEDILLEVDKLREVSKTPSQASLITETEFKEHDEQEAANMKVLQFSEAVTKNPLNAFEEHQRITRTGKAEQLQDDDDVFFPDKMHGVDRNQLEDSGHHKTDARLVTRLEDLERLNEIMLCELKQIRNGGEDIEKTERSGEKNKETKSCCSCRMGHGGINASPSGSTEFTWELNGFGDILANFQNNVLQEIESDTFHTQEEGYEMRAKLILYKGFLSIYLAFVPGEHGENTSVYFHRRTFVVLDQRPARGSRRDLVRSWEPSFGSKNTEKWMKEFWGSLHFVPLVLLENSDRYLKNGTICIKIVIEPLATLYKALTANDGVLFWKVEDYTSQKEREADGLTQGLKSDYFYSSAKGYRLQMELCLNGHGEENKEHVSAFIWFRRGPFDDFLPKRFAHRTTIWVLDQSEGEEKVHLRKVVLQDRIRNTIYSKLALQSTIEESRYLKNDALLVKVIVEPVEDKEALGNENC